MHQHRLSGPASQTHAYGAYPHVSNRHDCGGDWCPHFNSPSLLPPFSYCIHGFKLTARSRAIAQALKDTFKGIQALVVDFLFTPESAADFYFSTGFRRRTRTFLASFSFCVCVYFQPGLGVSLIGDITLPHLYWFTPSQYWFQSNPSLGFNRTHGLRSGPRSTLSGSRNAPLAQRLFEGDSVASVRI
jgi:hypothetical protein